jgi:hypothetical protein
VTLFNTKAKRIDGVSLINAAEQSFYVQKEPDPYFYVKQELVLLQSLSDHFFYAAIGSVRANTYPTASNSKKYVL